MGRVRLLPDAVASQVAAGEVVERPASLLKELLENSLDARARRIEVQWVRGGSGLIFVQDDGVGMEREDALLALERHATSKIRTGDDLGHITSFGFRGEALPSIASVTRFRLTTRSQESGDLGTQIDIEGGKILDVREGASPQGTTVEARDLFFNLPARKKFLRSESTESAHLLHQFQTIALAHADVAFVLQKDGRLLHRLGATGELRVRVRDLFGAPWEETLVLPDALERSGIRVSGLLSKPGYYRLDRSGQFFFLNRRPVQDAAIARGLRAALGPQAERTHPAVILFLEMDPARYDCNVHPAKKEVRFQRPDDVSSAVEAFGRQIYQSRFSGHDLSRKEATPGIPIGTHFAEKGALSGKQTFGHSGELRRAPETLDLPLPVEPRSAEPHPDGTHLPHQMQAPTSADSSQGPSIPGGAVPPPPGLGVTAAPAGESLAASPEEGTSGGASSEASHGRGAMEGSRFAFRGCLGKDYALWESHEGLVLMEVRHAWERIYYEEMVRAGAPKTSHQGGEQARRFYMPAQQLLPPEVLTLPPRDAAWVRENVLLLQEFGFVVEMFGEQAIKVEAVPAGVEGWTAEQLLLRFADEARGSSRSGAQRFVQDALCLALATLRAARQRMTPNDAQNLLRRLFACEMPYVSPHGRPVLLQMGWKELERKFRPERSAWE